MGREAFESDGSSLRGAIRGATEVQFGVDFVSKMAESSRRNSFGARSLRQLDSAANPGSLASRFRLSDGEGGFGGILVS